MDAALDCLRLAGCTLATLWVLERNERAMAFYASRGFTPDGATRPDVIGGVRVRDLRYRLPLQ
ncbi:GNAT family N-acetyltransferase [Actinokineospora sp. NPDC004072]